MKKLFAKICFSLFLIILPNILLSQDSLYLTGTITGESNAKIITDVKGIGDVNGDGYDDFIVTSGYHNAALYLGSLSSNLTPSIIFHYPRKDTLTGFGGCAGIGDVNGDGYNDFLIRGSFADGGFSKGIVFLYFGGLNIDTIPRYEFYEPWIEDWFGREIEGIGDINKDGYDDFIISSPYNWSNGKGKVYLFYGGDTISLSKSITFIDTLAIGKFIDSFFGWSVANIGDINKDGFDDIAMSVGYDPSELSEKVYIYYGGNPMDTVLDTVLVYNNLEYNFGIIIKYAGDLNGDRVTEFCIGGIGKIFIFDKINEPFFIKGNSLCAGVDINHDGYNDLIIGDTQYSNSEGVMVGGAFVYLGGEMIDTVYEYKLEGENKWDEFSKTITSADINSDGYDELFILAPNYPDYNNPVGKIYIYSYKNPSQVEVDKEIIPDKFGLYQNFPNPFNSNTTVRFLTPPSSSPLIKGRNEAGFVTLKVYDILGREIATLVDGIQKPGEHTVSFNASGLSSGVYFYRLKTGNFVTQKSMLLLK